jgi:hypothetical protein
MVKLGRLAEAMSWLKFGEVEGKTTLCRSKFVLSVGFSKLLMNVPLFFSKLSSGLGCC